MHLSGESRAILLGIHSRHQAALASSDPLEPWRQAALEDVLLYGPTISISAWFGCQPDGAVYRRYRRALAHLIDDGLVATSRADGAKLQNVKLTCEGQAMVDNITNTATMTG